MSDQNTLLEDIGDELIRIESSQGEIVSPTAQQLRNRAIEFITNPSTWHKILDSACSAWTNAPQQQNDEIIDGAADAVTKMLPSPYNSNPLAKKIVVYLMSQGIAELCRQKPPSPPIPKQ